MINQSLRIHNFSQQNPSVLTAPADTSSVGAKTPDTPPEIRSGETQNGGKKMRKLIPVVGPLLAAVVAMVPIVGVILAGILA